MKSYKTVKRLLVSFIILLATNVHSAGYLTNLNSPKISITKIFSHSNGAITLFVTGVDLNPDECGLVSHLHIKADNLGFKNMLSLALSAQATGKKIGVYSSGCEVIPFWGGTVKRPIVRELWISN